METGLFHVFDIFSFKPMNAPTAIASSVPVVTLASLLSEHGTTAPDWIGGIARAIAQAARTVFAPHLKTAVVDLKAFVYTDLPEMTVRYSTNGVITNEAAQQQRRTLSRGLALRYSLHGMPAMQRQAMMYSAERLEIRWDMFSGSDEKCSLQLSNDALFRLAKQRVPDSAKPAS